MQDKQKELEDQCKADDGLDVGDPCPKCGSPLVLRQSSHGEFLGFPDLSLVKFSVTQYGIDMKIFFFKLSAHRNTAGCGNALT